MMAQSFAIYLLFVLGSYHCPTHAFVSPTNYAAISQRTINDNSNSLQIQSPDDSSQRQQHTRGTRTSLNLAGGFEEAWSAYLNALEADPLLVKSITAGVILGAADLSGQAIQSAIAANNRDDDFDGDADGLAVRPAAHTSDQGRSAGYQALTGLFGCWVQFR